MKNQLAKHDKLDVKIAKLHEFLMLLCVKCSAGPTSFTVSPIIRNSDGAIPRETMAVLIEKAFVKQTGILSGAKYHWIGVTPTLEDAENIFNRAREMHNDYRKDKKAEKNGHKQTIRTGLKTFTRVIRPEQPIQPKDTPQFCTTPTEISVEANLNKLARGLEGRNTMDFNMYCEAKFIPMPIQFAVISLGLITKEKGKGYKFVKDVKVNYELVRKVIEKKREYVPGVTQMPEIVETEPTVNSVMDAHMGSVNKPATEHSIITSFSGTGSLLEKDKAYNIKLDLAERFAKAGRYEMALSLMKEVEEDQNIILNDFGKRERG